MIRSSAVFPLLLLKGQQHIRYRLKPFLTEDRGIARHQPIPIGKADGIAERIYLVFPLKHFRAHVRLVGLPSGSRRTVIESIRIAVDVDALELPKDNAANHPPQRFVLIGKLHVGPHLSARIAQPHGWDIARIDKRVVFAVNHPIVDSRLQRVRKTVGKHPRQLRVALQFFLHLLDGLLNDFRGEQAVFHWRTLRDIRLHIVRHDLFITLMHIHLSVYLCAERCSKHGADGCRDDIPDCHGRSAFLVPNFEGAAPISNSNVPPRMMSSNMIYDLV